MLGENTAEILRNIGYSHEEISNLVARSVCPKCGKEDFEKVPARSGMVMESVELIATPDPYPESGFPAYGAKFIILNVGLGSFPEFFL